MTSRIVAAKVMWMKQGADTEGVDGSEKLSLLASLYRRYVARVYALCLRLLTDVRAAEDATVAVFVRLGRELSGYLEESKVLARLRQLSIEETVTRLRVRGKRVAPRMTPAPVRAPDAPVLPALDRETLGGLVARLPDTLRVAFVLRDQEGLSDTAIAAHLQINEADVRRLVHAARLELRRLWLTPD